MTGWRNLLSFSFEKDDNNFSSSEEEKEEREWQKSSCACSGCDRKG